MQKNTHPRISVLETLKGFLSEGYDFISEKSREVDADVFETLLFSKKIIFMRGKEAAKLFYDNEKFTRQGASPKLIQKTLFGEGGVQGLDGEAHKHRKAMFMGFMNPGAIGSLAELFKNELETATNDWGKKSQIEWFHEINMVIFKAVCNWAAVPIRKESVENKTQDFLNMIEGAGTLGLKHWKGRRSRVRAEKWIGKLVERIRNNSLVVPDNTVIKEISLHRDLEGNLLPVEVAAVEIINIIRPTLAVGRFLTFAATALHEFPEKRQLLIDEQIELIHFAQEVRRYYPFFPMVPAISKLDFEWKSIQFDKNTKVFLDLYGTNHHPEIWGDPENFRPERFINWDQNPYTLIPQGGGDFHKHHRCPGEMITLELLKTGVNFLLNKISYEVPPQDLSVKLNTFPSIPKSKFIMEKIRKK
jgi:fatty-acid peroxygenase